MAGKRKREGGQTREAKRLAHLFDELIAETGVSQSELARQLDVHNTYVNKWISGEREGVGAEIIGRACKAFGVDPLYFFEDYKGERSHHDYPLRRLADLRVLAEKVARLNEPEEDSKVQRYPRR